MKSILSISYNKFYIYFLVIYYVFTKNLYTLLFKYTLIWFIGIDEYQAKRETIKEKLKKNLNLDSLSSTQLRLASDYYNDSEMSVKFKKVKVCIITLRIMSSQFNELSDFYPKK